MHCRSLSYQLLCICYSVFSHAMTDTVFRVGHCPGNCSGHGVCQNSSCECDNNHMGDRCEIRRCPNSCSGHGHCADGLCRCDSGYKGTVMVISFRTDRSEQTVQPQIRLLLEEKSDQGLHCLQFYLHLFDEIP